MQGRLDISQTMPTQNLIQDLLSNGIDLSFLDPDDPYYKLRHSSTINLRQSESKNKKGGVDSEERKNEGDGIEVAEFEPDSDEPNDLEDMMDKLLLSGDNRVNYNKSKSMVVKTLRNNNYNQRKERKGKLGNIDEQEEFEDSIIDDSEIAKSRVVGTDNKKANVNSPYLGNYGASPLLTLGKK